MIELPRIRPTDVGRHLCGPDETRAVIVSTVDSEAVLGGCRVRGIGWDSAVFGPGGEMLEEHGWRSRAEAEAGHAELCARYEEPGR